MVGVQQWADVRRMVLVERLSQREVARLTAVSRQVVYGGSSSCGGLCGDHVDDLRGCGFDLSAGGDDHVE